MPGGQRDDDLPRHWLSRVRLAGRPGWDNEARARVALEAVRHLAAHADSPEQWDAVIELQRAAFALHEAPSAGIGLEMIVHRFVSASGALDNAWPGGSRTLISIV
ncbi:hypothetical protein [Salinarimonas soli]|uniref:Uncharacterized protein n=1 Tax=Salinarimonas soli TaxID=1638099 RepID=A0A5B2V7K9_9HYPH|nr:hypothetical protein [Salinarimonas soli]KAA2234796.1 hypothetical protein F0L46_22875 [Salinarimonas soli]